MSKTKQIFAVLFTVMAVLLLNTAVYAYTGNGTEENPYIVETFDDLKSALEKGGYVKLGCDISKNNDITITVTKEVHLDLSGHTINLTKVVDDSSIVVTFLYSDKANIYIDDSGEGGGINLKCTALADTVNSRIIGCKNQTGKIIINGGRLVNDTGYIIECYVYYGNGTRSSNNITINGGELITKDKPIVDEDVIWLTINGGILKSETSPAVIWLGGGDSTSSHRLLITGGEIYGMKLDYPYILGEDRICAIRSCTVHSYIKMASSSYYVSAFFRTYKPYVNIDGTIKTYDNLKVNKIEGENIVVYLPDNYIGEFKPNGEVTPIPGHAVVLPTAPTDAKYRITSAKWLDYDAPDEEVTVFGTNVGTYYLLVDAEVKDTENDTFLDDIKCSLPETSGSYTVTRSTVTVGTKLSAVFKFIIQPVITQQPQSVTVSKAGNEATFTVNAYNTESYEWCLTDKSGKAVDWETAKTNNIVSADNTSGSTLKVKVLSVKADEYHVYCKLTYKEQVVASKSAYIYWQKLNVTFDANGGSGTMNSSFAYANTPFVLPECTFTAPSDEVMFYKWTTGNRKFYEGEEVIISQDTTFTAQWEQFYTVTYDYNGGTGDMKPERVIVGTKYTFPECTLTPPQNRLFRLWGIGSYGYYPGQQINITQDTTVMARWRDYGVISFDPGEGSGTMESQQVTLGTAFTLPNATQTFTPPANGKYRNSGWIIDGKTYSVGSTVKFTKDTTITAVWTEYCIVRYDKNGGYTGTMGQEQFVIDKGKKFTLGECLYSPPAHQKFKCWEVNGTEYAPGAKITINIDPTYIKAVWWDMFTVTFDTDGMCTPPEPQLVKYGEHAVEPTAPKVEGYVFNGWYTDTDFAYEHKYYFTGTTLGKIENDTTLYACFKAVTEDDVRILGFDPVIHSGMTKYDASYVSVPDGAGYRVARIDWYLAGTTQLAGYGYGTLSFAAGQEYEAEFTILPLDGKSFGDNTINDKRVLLNDSTELLDYDNERNTFESGKIYIRTKPITAHGSCTISYMSNGGTGNMNYVRVAQDTEFILPECSFTAPEGKYFIGWRYDSEGELMDAGDTIIVPSTSNIWLYAQWANKGDINADGVVDKKDAAYLLKYISGTRSLTEGQLEMAKMNSDEAVDMLDVIAILKNQTA